MQIRSYALMAAATVALTAAKPAVADLVNEDACAIWLCLPQGFLPSACHPALLEMMKRKAMPFTPAIPPIHQCIVTTDLALTDLGDLSQLGDLSFSETRSKKGGEERGDKYVETFNDCTAIRLNGQQIGQSYCFNDQVETDLEDWKKRNDHDDN